MMKKIKIVKLFLIAAVICTLSFFVGCSCSCSNRNNIERSNTGSFSSGESRGDEYQISHTEVTLPRFTKILLGVTSGYTTTWSSSDENVAKVTQAGEVTGLKTGTTIITAANGTDTLSCTVTVIASEYYPNIRFSETDLSISENQNYEIQAEVVANDIVLDEALTWYTTDAAVASVTDGTIVGVSEGTAKIGCQFDFENELVNAEIEVSVKGSCAVVFNVPSVNLYAEKLQVDQTTKRKVTATAYDGNALQTDAQFSFSSMDENVATVSSDGTIQAVREGETFIVARWQKDGGYVENAVPVKVTAPEIVVSGQVFFAKNMGYMVQTASTVLGALDGDEIVVTDYETKDEFAARLNKGVLSIEFSEEHCGRRVLRISDGKTARVVNVCIATMIVDNANMFEASDAYGGLNALQYFGGATKANNYTWGGYFILSRNLDLSGINVKFTNANGNNQTAQDMGFVGEFDGNGYALENAQLASYGSLLGNTGKGAYVHDLRVLNLQATDTLCYGVAGYFANGTFENLYVQGAKSIGSTFGILGYTSAALTLSDSVFIVENIEKNGIINSPLNIGSMGYRSIIKNVEYYGNGFAIGANAEAGAGFGVTPHDYEKVVEKNYYDKTTAKDYEITLAGATSVLVNGKDITDKATISDNKITVPSSQVANLSVGNPHYIMVKAQNGATAMARLVIPTLLITSAEQFIPDSTGYNALQKVGGATLENYSTYSGYFVLANDIDFNGALISVKSNKASNVNIGDGYYGFNGTFDGQGYSIRNGVIGGGFGSLFGSTTKKAVIENVAFEGFSGQGNMSLGILGYTPNGLLKNVFMSGKIKSQSYGLLGGFSRELNLVNCVFVFEAEDTAPNNRFLLGNYYRGSVSNSYAFSSMPYVYRNPVTTINKLRNYLDNGTDSGDEYKNHTLYDFNNKGKLTMPVYCIDTEYKTIEGLIASDAMSYDSESWAKFDSSLWRKTFEFTLEQMGEQGFDTTIWRITQTKPYPHFRSK